MSDDHKNRFESNKKYFTICIYALCVIVIGAFLIYLIINGRETRRSIQKTLLALAPFLIAFFIAYLLNPVVREFDRLLEKWIFKDKMPRLRQGLSIFFSYAIAVGVLSVAVIYVVPQLFRSLQDIAVNRVPPMVNAVTDFLNNLETNYPNLDFKFIQDQLEGLKPHLLDFGTDLVATVFPALVNLSVSVVKIVINFVLSIVISCYLLTDKKLLTRNAKRCVYALFPKSRAANLCETARECNSIFSSFIVGKSIDSLIIGILCFFLMSLFRMPYALLISVIVGITNMIPYFGPFIGAVPGVLIYLFISPLRAIGFAFMILVLQQFDGLYLGPKILGDSTGLKPLWVIFAITIGGAYFGPLGMFLGVPVVAVIAYLLNSFITRRLKDRHLENEIPD